MKLAFKLTFVIMVTMVILFSIHSYLVVEREIDLFQEDMERHANLVGGILGSSAADIIASGGIGRIRQIIRDANASETLLRVRWVRLDSTDADAPHPAVDRQLLQNLDPNKPLLIHQRNQQGAKYLYAYFPIMVDNAPPSALEVSQPMEPMYAYIRNTIARKVILLFAMVVVGTAIIWVLGAGMVGHPVRSMVALARQVGSGNLEGSVIVKKQKDELTELATGLNVMVEHLRESQRRLQEETAKKIETLQQLHHSERLATVGKLASGLAHELGTPLNVISGRAKMIASQQLNENEESESARIIAEQSDRMTNIIRQLLDFARLRKPEKQVTNLIDIIKRISSMLKPLASQHKVTFEISNEAPLPAVEIDPGQMQQVFSNLIVNAIYAMPDGGPIRIRLDRARAQPPADLGGNEDQYLCIKISDEGVGIPKDDLARIFTPFFTTKDVSHGTGLGLSIAHGIVREHAGWIAVESVEGKGSTFSVYLPLKEEA
jgi:two-component system NtrC family sensor kinase